MIETSQPQELYTLFGSIARIQDNPIETARLARTVRFVNPNQLTGKVEAQRAGTVTLGESHNLSITFQKMGDGAQRIRLRITEVGEPVEKKGRMIRPEIHQIDTAAIVINSNQPLSVIELPIIITAFAQYHNLNSQMELKVEKILNDTAAALTVISQKDWA